MSQQKKNRGLRGIFGVFSAAIGIQIIGNALLWVNIIEKHSYFTLHIIMCLLTLLIVLIAITKEKNKLREYGFSLSRNTRGILCLSLFFATAFIIVNIFLFGGTANFEAFPQPSPSYDLFLEILNIVVTCVTVEVLFRGYIQTRFKKAYGFPKALFMSALMSTTYMPFLAPTSGSWQWALLPLHLLTIFSESCFLAVLFDRSKTLLGPIMFTASALTFYTITPLKVLAPEYLRLVISVVTYIFFALLAQHLLEE